MLPQASGELNREELVLRVWIHLLLRPWELLKGDTGWGKKLCSVFWAQAIFVLKLEVSIFWSIFKSWKYFHENISFLSHCVLKLTNSSSRQYHIYMTDESWGPERLICQGRTAHVWERQSLHSDSCLHNLLYPLYFLFSTAHSSFRFPSSCFPNSIKKKRFY